MKLVLYGLLKRLLFWMLFFALLRMVFLAYYQQQIMLENIVFPDVLAVFWHALPLDFSTACYILLFSYVMLMLRQLNNNRLFISIDNFVAFVVMLVYALISVAELGLYGEWNTKMSFKALSYLSHPDEVFNSISTFSFVLLFAFWLMQTIIPYIFYSRMAVIEPKSRRKRSPSAWWTLLFVPLILVLGTRGGLGEIPISTSSAYFSQHQILNLAAVNSGNNMIVSTLNSSEFGDTNPFISMPEAEADSIVRQMHKVEGDSTLRILKINKPNIVVLLLESWSGDLIESLGGEAGITPNFRELEKDGLLFTSFYASGNRSQQAMGSLFSGLPGLPITTITAHPEKYAALPSFIKDIKTEGYHTGFWFGGQLIYGNILSYLMANEFDEIIEGKDLPGNFERGKLGVHDEFMLQYVAKSLGERPEPFFATIFTLSSHSPYDFPMPSTIQWPQKEKPFVNSAHYTDKSLGDFFAIARQQSWYDSTLFVIVADHSHNTYKNHPLASFEYHKIPLLLCGPALADSLKGSTYDMIAGNTDIPATILAQLGMDHKAYTWSKDLFNANYSPFAFFELNEGFGYMRPDGFVVWDHMTDRFIQKSTSPENEALLLREGQAYEQVLFGDFLKY
ncbi:MAG: sulfatase-like hydrolase/transferase [Bacteroidales bacterium]|nr:sulfatase-like hydrolase/transferase [Bacteroidales bacterium]